MISPIELIGRWQFPSVDSDPWTGIKCASPRGFFGRGCTGVKKRPTVGRKKNLLWVLFLGYPKALSGRAGKRGRKQGCIPLKLQRLLGRRERVGDFSFQGGGRSLLRSLGSRALGRPLRLRRGGELGQSLWGCWWIEKLLFIILLALKRKAEHSWLL